MSVPNHDECIAAGLNPKAVSALLKRANRLGADAKAMGITIFGGSGSGTLRARDEREARDGPLIVGSILGGIWDGGDGGEHFDDDGLLRGEGV